jgi:hypothetical protein
LRAGSTPDSEAAFALRPDFAFVALEGGGIDVVDQLPEAWTRAVARFVLDDRVDMIR